MFDLLGTTCWNAISKFNILAWVDPERRGSGMMSASGICLVLHRGYWKSEHAIQNWLDEPDFDPSGLRGIYELAYFADDSKLTMSFSRGMDHYT